jgi:hypothetical protein
MLMNELDPLDSLLREWKAPESPAEMDRRIKNAYRAAMDERTAPWWRAMWSARLSVPVPVLLAAIVVLALLFWLRSPSSTVPANRNAVDVTTQLDATGFEPLPNGEARIIPVKETNK